MNQKKTINIDQILMISGLAGIAFMVASVFTGTVVFIIGFLLSCVAFANTVRIVLSGDLMKDGKKLGTGAIGVLSVFCLIGVTMGSIVTVEAGNVGVVTNSPNSNLYGTTLNEGWNFNPSFALSNVEIIRYNSQISEYVGVDSSDDLEGSIMILSSDNLQIFLDFSIRYHIPKDKVWDIRSNYGSDWKTVIIHQIARSVPRMECANYTALEIIGADRATIEMNISQKVTDAIEMSGIVVESLQIREIRLPDSLSAAIEAKLVANQQLEQSEILLQKASIDAQAIQALRKSFASDEAYLSYLYALALTDPDSNVQYVYLPTGTTTTVPVKT